MSDFNVNPNVGGPSGSYPNSPPADTADCDIGVIPEADLLALVNTAAKVEVDGQVTEQRSLADIIALDKHLSSRRAACSGSGGWGAVGKSKVVPPSATGC